MRDDEAALSEPLGEFADRYTFRYEREYPHPPERVWEAITSAEQLDAWFMPHNNVEAKAGGRVSFSFGGPPEYGVTGHIAEFIPPEVVEYEFDNGGRLRFELQPTERGTKLFFSQYFPPGFVFPDGLEEDEAQGTDLPGGPDTPWRPGMLAGYHLALASLGTFLDGNGPTVEDQIATIEKIAAGTYYDPVDAELTLRYRQLVKETLPR